MIICATRPREKRESMAKPSDGWVDLWTGGKTASGERMSPARAMTVPAYYAALRAISEDCAKLPLPLYERKDKGRERRMDHPVYRILNTRANPEMGAMAWRATTIHHALGWGNGYSEIQRDTNDVPRYLWPLDPTTVRVCRNAGHELVYEVTGPRRRVTLAARDVFHLRGLGYNGIMGYSIAQLARETLGLAKAQETAGSAMIGNNSRPGGVLETPHKLNKEAKDALKEHWATTYQGAENAGKTVVLSQDMKFKPVAPLPHKDSQWIEARHLTVEDFCRCFRMPPHKLQQLLYAHYNNVTEQNIEYVTDCLTSWFIYFEQEAQYKLLAPHETNLYVSHLAMALLRGAPKARNEAYAIQRDHGVLSANEWRELEDLNPLPGDQGDMYLVPVNMAPLDSLRERYTGNGDGDGTDIVAQGPKGDAGEKGDTGDRGAKGDTGTTGDTGERGAKGEQGGKGLKGNDGAQGDTGLQGEPGVVDKSVMKLVASDALRQAMREASVTSGEKLPGLGGTIDLLADKYRVLLHEVYSRILRHERDKAARALRRNGAEPLEDFYAEHAKRVRSELGKVVDVFCQTVWTACGRGPYPQHVDKEAGKHTAGMVERHISLSRKQIEEQGAVETNRGDYSDEMTLLASLIKRLCGLRETQEQNDGATDGQPEHAGDSTEQPTGSD